MNNEFLKNTKSEAIDRLIKEIDYDIRVTKSHYNKGYIEKDECNDLIEFYENLKSELILKKAETINS